MLPRFLFARIAAVLILSACLPPAGAGAQSLIARVETGSYPHAVVVDAAANRVYVANYYANTVSVIDALTNAVTMTLPISGAWDIDLNPQRRRLYVSRDYVAQYIVHDADNGNWLASVPSPRWARAIAVNAQTDRVYVANVFDNQVRVFNGTTNQQLAVIPVSNWLFDLAVDAEKNLVYGANYGNGTLTVIDGATNAVTHEIRGGVSGNAWGVAVNSRTNKIYLTQINGDEVAVIDRTTLALLTTLRVSGAAGIAINERTNRVFVTQYGQGLLAVIDGTTDTVVSHARVGGKWPERVDVHPGLGRVYVTDDFNTNTVSVFQDVLPNTAPNASAGADQTVECASHDGARVTLDGSASSDADGDSLSYEWRNAGGAVVGTGARSAIGLPLGTHTFTLTVTDDDGATASDTVTITVRDTTPPVIASATATPSVLWPPDGRMAAVAVDVALADTCDATAACRIVDVRSSEPAGIRGAGRRTPDWEITGAMSLRLRAERSGTGPGRVYTVAIECRDGSGNASRRAVEVLVPHDRR